MKILLIKPPMRPEEEFGDFSVLGSCEPPQGLCCLAAYARKHHIEVEIIDAIALHLTLADVVEIVIKSDAHAIGLTAETAAIHNAADIARMVKEKRPTIATIIGGTHITALPDETMKRYKHFDYGVLGEGEVTLVDLMQTIGDKRPAQSVLGLIIRTSKGLVKTSKRGLIESLDDLPLPAWDLLPDIRSHYYLSAYSIKRSPSISLTASRGCAFKCLFCFQGVFHGKVRKYSTLTLVKMVTLLKDRYGIKEFRFQDDNFLSYKSDLLLFCDCIKKEGIQISWSCLARPDCIDGDVLKKMKEAGCWQILVGIESGSQEILNKINKKTTLFEIKKAIQSIRELNMRSVGYFIIGYPWETKKTIKETIDFAKALSLDDFRINYLVPFPKTGLHSVASAKGKCEHRWEKMNFFTGPCYIPEGLTKKEIVSFRKIAYISFYVRPSIIFSYIKRMMVHPILALQYTKGALVLIKYVCRLFFVLFLP